MSSVENENAIPKFPLREEQNDVSVQVRVSQMENGFAVRTGGIPIHYHNINDAAEAVKNGLIAIKWPAQGKKNE